MSFPRSQISFAILAAEIVEPAPERTPDRWADDHRKLPPGSAERGKMRTSRTPYVIPIGRAFQRWSIREIYFTMGRQMAKTNGVIFNVSGQRLDDDPVPILYIGPTRDNIDDVIEPKVQYMLESTPSLWSKTLRGQKNKKHMKIVNAVSFRFAWAGSDTGLKADAAGLVWIDEIDGIEAERPTAGEGTVKDMAAAITSSFPEGQVGCTSTPTHGAVEAQRNQLTGMEHWQVSDEVISAIWRYWQEGSRHEWAWPCPECKAYFIPRSKHLRPVEDCSPEQAEREGHLGCPNCGSEIHDRHRVWMNARGVMVAPGQAPMDYEDDWGLVDDEGPVGPGVLMRRAPGAEPERVPWGDSIIDETLTKASFWVSGLCTFSSRNSFGYMAERLVSAKKSLLPQRIQGVYNTIFGEVYLQRGDAPAWTEVKSIAAQSDYATGQVPARVTTLTCGVDLGDDAMQWSVVGWVPGTEWESYRIAHGEFFGDTDQDDIWELLKTRVLDWTFGGLQISFMAIDSGHRPERVYSFCKANDKAIPTKGRDTMDAWWKAVKPEVDKRGKTKRFGLKLWHINTDVVKSWVHAQVKHSARVEITWHLPRDIDDEYCKQIASESRLIDHRGVPYWRKHRANHFFDCEALNWFAVNQIVILDERPENKKAAPASAAPFVSSWQPDTPWLSGG